MIVSYLLIIGGCIWILEVEKNIYEWNTGLADVLKGILPSILIIAGSILLWNALWLNLSKKQILTIFQFSIISVVFTWLAAHWFLALIFFLNTRRHKK